MKIAVVGDVLLDVDMFGDADRLSPDAPVPVVDVQETVHRPGGAGLVASMLAEDGEEVQLITALSTDEWAGKIRAALAGVSITAAPLLGPTPVKTRVRASGQAVVRIDTGCRIVPVPEFSEEMLYSLDSVDAIVVADYGRGITRNALLRSRLEQLAPRIPIVWDPHPSGTTPVPGVAAVTPNASEAAKFSGIPARGTTSAAAAAERLMERWVSSSVVVTLGGMGALLLEQPAQGLPAGSPSVPQVLPAPRTVVDDPCGAGDRFAASLALRLAAHEALPAAVQAAVEEAAHFLSLGGVAHSSYPEEPEAMSDEFGLSAADLARRVRAQQGTVVATGGCFDLVHAGHVRTLEAARKLGDCLIVCLNSDDSVRRLKGPDRPVISLNDRVELLMALKCVDAVAVFDEDTPERILAELRPHLWIKGGDYAGTRLPESELLEQWGGRTITLPHHPARSTTKLAAVLEKIG
ncbi:PfkB family carbohydrate kinase [Arthrobacter sp. ISL-30]|uniref:PfkB family carbohydrate kinase n=1 Tax=Arthrobacter sp. ISL-30 TaxID=2819109 RepID=UPI001BE540B2|nr:PfkB family carbohydrate kinase [Arthrobacter sp. ISL-30]MBT2513785.1 bifunctional heptose 7-phosphate kinase/heptose 1-phosphate adenyltransferase [Arthrobacter sp. ISL-30]